MNRKYVFVTLLAVILLVVVSAGGVALARPLDFDLSWHVIGGGGGHSEAGSYVLDATVGQAVAGIVSNPPYNLCTGFWCGMGVYKTFLPLVMRNS